MYFLMRTPRSFVFVIKLYGILERETLHEFTGRSKVTFPENEQD